MKKPFSINDRERVESGGYKVVLSNGNRVRILAWDCPGDFPIVAADWPEGDEVETRVETYTKDGWDGVGEKKQDLFIQEIPAIRVGILPVWKKATINDKGWRFYAGRSLYHDGYYISLDELLALPKES